MLGTRWQCSQCWGSCTQPQTQTIPLLCTADKEATFSQKGFLHYRQVSLYFKLVETWNHVHFLTPAWLHSTTSGTMLKFQLNYSILFALRTSAGAESSWILLWTMWGLSSTLPSHHTDRTLLSVSPASVHLPKWVFTSNNHLSMHLSAESIIPSPKNMRKVFLPFPFLFPFHSPLSNLGEMKGKAEGEREQSPYIFFTFSLTWFPSLPVCNLLLQSSAYQLFIQTAPILLSHFYSQSKAWTSRGAMCPAHPLWIVSSHKRSSGIHYTN